MDRSLDEIIGNNDTKKRGYRRNHGSVRKSRDHGRGRRNDRQYRDNRKKRLLVSNLHYELNETDIYDLFSQVGDLAEVHLHYDKAGRSEGSATVEYSDPADIDEAIRRFDGKTAVGMKISVKVDIPLENRIGARPRRRDSRNNRKSRSPRSDDKDKKRNGGRRQKKSLEELDAELNNYMGIEGDNTNESTAVNGELGKSINSDDEKTLTNEPENSVDGNLPTIPEAEPTTQVNDDQMILD